MADIVLIRPQEHDYDYLQWQDDVLLAHTYREICRKGLTCRVFDFALRPLLSEMAYEQAMYDIESQRPRLCVLVIDKHPTNSPYYAGRFIAQMRTRPALRGVHLAILGNTQVGTERLLVEFDLDSVVLGEEFEAAMLAEAVVHQLPLESVDGIMYRSADSGAIRSRPPGVRHDRFAESQRPRRYVFELPENERNPYGYVPSMEASRGCYAKCTFCYIRSKERTYGSYTWVGRDAYDVVEEMAELYHDHDVREFSFVDPQFFGPGRAGQEWASRLARLIIDHRLDGIAFSIYARANDIREPTISLLRDAGLYAVFIGIESFSDGVLRRYRKGLTVAVNMRAIEKLMDLGIRLRMGFISFDAETTIDELRESVSGLQHLLTLKPELITQPVFFQNILSPLEDTPLGDDYQSRGLSLHDPQDSSSLLLAARQRILSRGGPISRFADWRISALSELTRILGSEITQRSTQLEIAVSSILAENRWGNKIHVSDVQIDASSILPWFDHLTALAITEFIRLFEAVEKAPAVTGIDHEELVKEIELAIAKYDLEHLGVELGVESRSAHVVID
jgi:hypothetical protein